jgi:hypothetical protein
MAWLGRRAPDLEGVPDEEGISDADAARRVDEDPDEQVNYTEQTGQQERGIAELRHPEDS